MQDYFILNNELLLIQLNFKLIMKKVFYLLIVSISFFACKKEKSSLSSSSSGNSSTSSSVSKSGSGVVDANGKSYKTIIIGNQEWMASNLDVTKYNDGTTIKGVDGDLDMNSYYTWMALKEGVWCNHMNMLERGKIYNGYVVESKKVCPTGWHIPSKAEWETLINNLGGDENAGVKLKQTGYQYWSKSEWSSSSDTATNSSGFTAIPTGAISSGFNLATLDAWYWTSDLTAVVIHNEYHYVSIRKEKEELSDASAIRCIKN